MGFIWEGSLRPMDAEQLRENAHKIVNFVADYYKSLGTFTVHSQVKIEYCKAIRLPRNLKLPTIAIGCNCKGECVDPKICSCAKLNGGDFPYVWRDGGRLIETKSIVFECGPSCGCNRSCVNRTSQQGLNYRLEVFRKVGLFGLGIPYRQVHRSVNTLEYSVGQKRLKPTYRITTFLTLTVFR